MARGIARAKVLHLVFNYENSKHHAKLANLFLPIPTSTSVPKMNPFIFCIVSNQKVSGLIVFALLLNFVDLRMMRESYVSDRRVFLNLFLAIFFIL